MKPTSTGMNLYLRVLSCELNFIHGLFILYPARSLNPILMPRYEAAVEKRTYTETLLVGIPGVSVFSTKEMLASTTAAISRLSQPVDVNVPITEKMQESYLEIQ